MINFLINSLVGGGTEKVCCQIASELADKGRKVNIYVLDDSGSSYHISKNVNVIYLGQATTARSFGKIYRLIENIKGERLLVFNHELALVALVIKKATMSNITIISRINNTLSYTIKHKSLKYRLVIPALMKLLYRYIDGFIFQSQGIKDDIITNYGVSKNYTVINNPVTVNDKEYHCDKHEFYILYVGRLVKQKNVEDTIKSFGFVLSQIPNIKLKIVGDGPERENLILLTKKLEMEKSVEFCGYQKDTARFFKNAQLTVLSSFNEGFPNVLLESIATGTPVVSYDCPSGPRDIIDDSNGVLVPYLDNEALARAIVDVVNQDWAPSSVRSTIHKYDVETISRQYFDFLEMCGG